MMGNKRSIRKPLSARQQRLVLENRGLVALHIKRFVPGLAEPRRDREWDDLFQEGCLGLIRAAETFDPQRGIPFAAYALPRIHGAVHKALHTRFATIAVPLAKAHRPGTKGKNREDDDDDHCSENQGASSERDWPVPKVTTLGDRALMHVAAENRRPAADLDAPDGETVGDRLREKYDRAVRRAASIVSRGASIRGDRGALVTAIVEQRLLVPQAEYRTAMRRIARETGSSYARVSQCELRIRECVRTILEGDPEFDVLDRRARSDPDGVDAAIDDALERDLIAASAERFMARLADPEADDRLAKLDTLVGAARDEIRSLIRDRFAGLGPDQRERWLAEPAERRSARRGDPAAKRSRKSRVGPAHLFGGADGGHGPPYTAPPSQSGALGSGHVAESKKRRDPGDGLGSDAPHRVEVRH